LTQTIQTYITLHQFRTKSTLQIILHHITTKQIYTINQTNPYLNQTVTKETDLQLH
jgi:dihydroorotase